MEKRIDDLFDWLDTTGKKIVGWFLIFAAGYFIGVIRWFIDE